MNKLQNRIESLSAELRATKRKLDDSGTWTTRKRGGRGRNAQRDDYNSQDKGNKGKGKGKFHGGGPNADMNGFNNRTNGGQTICFNFNRACGCADAPAGGRCSKGVHVCIKCGSNKHGMTSPDCKQR